jgi:uncharacterized membrane protein
MTEPWGTIFSYSALAIQIGCFIALIIPAIRFRNATFGILSLALIAWPLLGDILSLWASKPGRQIPEGMTQGEFITKIGVFVGTLQTLLILVATIMCLRSWMKYKKK